MSIFDALITAVKEESSAETDAEAGDILGLKPAVVAQCRREPRARQSWWKARFRRLWEKAYAEGLRDGRHECANKLLTAVEESHVAITQQEKATAFGVAQATVNHWVSGRTTPTVTSLTRLLNRRAMIRIQQVAEIEPIHPVNRGGGWWIDSDKNKRREWRDRLSSRYGLYLFLDSSRSVTYVGKADRTNLFGEIEQRLRDAKLRGTHFDTNLDRRSERSRPMVQGEVARYISVFEVSDNASIYNLEALLIRAFMNDHLNRNRERFKT